MHHYLVKSGRSCLKQFGNPVAAASYARRVFGPVDIVALRDINNTLNTYWMPETEEDYFRAALGADGIVLGAAVSAASIFDANEAAKATVQASSNAFFLRKAGADARRVRHAKLGVGTVLAETQTTVTVLFDAQKKPIRLVASSVQIF